MDGITGCNLKDKNIFMFIHQILYVKKINLFRFIGNGRKDDLIKRDDVTSLKFYVNLML